MTESVEKVVWAVADIVWDELGFGRATSYPNDVEGQSGSINNVPDNSICLGGTGWAFPTD